MSAPLAQHNLADRFQFVYAVRSGTFKTSLALPDGCEQVSGFYMAAS